MADGQIPTPSGSPLHGGVLRLNDISKAIVSSASKHLLEKPLVKAALKQFHERMAEDPKFKWALLGGSLYITARLLNFNCLSYSPFSTIFDYCYRHIRVPESLVFWTGQVDPDVPFGRLGYARCLEADEDVLEKFGVPMNTDKCLQSGISYTPGEIYQKFDLNEYDSKMTPLTWSYGPISDPTLIMPIGWYNDMSGKNQQFELFKRYMRIFGYLPPTAYEQLYRHCKVILLRINQHLIRVGDPDDKIYIIVTGAVDIFSNRIGPHGDFIRLRTALQGAHIASLFSVVDTLTGHSGNIKSVFAVSKLDSTKVLMFPISAFKDYLVRNQEYLVSSVVRLLERGYRFQYQVLHKALQLTNVVSSLDKEALYDKPDVDIPATDEELPENLQDTVIRSFMELLEIDDFDFIKENCKIKVYDVEPPTVDLNVIQNSVLNQQESAYKYVYVGKLESFHRKSNLNLLDQQAIRRYFQESIIPEPLFYTYSKEGVGGLTGLLAYSKVLFCRVYERSIILTMSKNTLMKLLQIHPLAVFPIAFLTIYRMSSFTRALDFAIDWTIAKEGQYIYHKEQMCHDSFLMLNGRARAYVLDSDEAKQRSIFEYRENDWIGLIESLLQSKRRSKTCVVIRETEFAKIPNALLRNIVVNYSSAAQVMLSFLVQRTLKSRKYEMNDLEVVDNHKETRRIHSIALVPAAEGLPYSVLAVEIKRHYLSSGSCLILTYAKILRDLNLQDISERDQFKIEMYTLKQLRTYDLVIFVCLTRVHYWNQVCSSHSEVMFSVGCSELPNIPTEPSKFEEDTVGKKISSRRKELILLHSMDVILPKNTREWLHSRDWLHFHHHIRLPKEAFELLGAIEEEEIERNYQSLRRDIHLNSDLSRFLRWIMGKTFGVLFSSGGARIGTQLGMLQALIEYKEIPIDMVVGTGAGFFIAVCYAIYQDYSKVQEIVEKVFRDFGELLKFHWDDYSIPYMGSSKGKRLLTYFYELFGSVQLEDAWIPICCVTTNLTSQDVRIDRNGPAWVFIRASLSHINHSPPICDPVDGDYICDGAHANSLPEDIIKEYGAEYIIAFTTIGGKPDTDYKADPNTSVFRFIRKIAATFAGQLGLANPTFETVFNSLAVTQTRMYAAGVETVSNLRYVVYVRPPVEHLLSQDWNNLPSFHRIGYFYMKAILDKNPYTEEIPFSVYWTNIKNTSTDLANEGGREVHIFN